MVPDYYAMLGVDARADRVTIEEALARAQPAWSAGTRNPKTKHLHQSYLDQIPALRRALLTDDVARAAYDAELATERKATLDRQLDELQRLVRLRSAKGGLTVTDRSLLRTEAMQRGVPPENLDRLLESIPPLPESPTAGDEAEPTPRDVIDPAMRRQIQVALDHLRRRDLYHVLDLTRDAPQAEILSRAEAERRRWMQKAQVTADKTAWLEAISYAHSHLGTPASRERYDRTLELEAEEAFLGLVGFALQSLERLDRGTHAVLEQEGDRLGLTPDAVTRRIRQVCRDRGVAMILEGASRGTSQGSVRLLRCRHCAGLTALGDSSSPAHSAECRHCGASLQWRCPVCRNGHWVDQTRCGCGFPIESLEPYERRFDLAKESYRSRDYPGAAEQLEAILQIAPRSQVARRAYDRTQERLREIKKVRGAWEIERNRGRMLAARKILDLWAKMVPASDPEHLAALTELHRRLGEAAQLTAEARALAMDDPAASRALYLKSLDLASDLPETSDGLLRCPPDAPRALRAEVENGRVRLAWEPPIPDHLGRVEYAVFRKRGGIPTSEGDGTLVALVDATEWVDLDVEPGVSYGYAVYTRRNGIDSITRTTAGELMAVAEVDSPTARPGRQDILLRWSLPAGAVGARVTRRRGTPPTTITDGEPVDCLRDHVHDTGLDEGAVYHYRISALFAGGGGLVASPGVVVSAIPREPAEPIESLEIGGGSVGPARLSWMPPARGQVLILRTNNDPGLAPGAALAPEQVAGLGGAWVENAHVDHAELPHEADNGVRFFTPVTCLGDQWVVGRTVKDVALADPTDLRAARVGADGKVHLRWRWSPQSVRSIVIARAGRSPMGPDDPQAQRFEVGESEYARKGYLSVSLPADPGGLWHLAVYAVGHVGDEQVVSRGQEPTARLVLPGPNPEVTVSYSLRPPRFPGRPWSLTFRTDPPSQEIPPMALVAHPRTVPLSVEDGEMIDRFPASRDGSTFRIRSDRNLGGHQVRIFPDPCSDPGAMPPVRLRHPERGRTRI